MTNTTELIGTYKKYNGVFELVRTDNYFRYVQQTKSNKEKDIYDDFGEIISKYGSLPKQIKLKIKGEGVVVGIDEQGKKIICFPELFGTDCFREIL